MHPETQACSTSSTVEAKPWFYTTDDLARGTVSTRDGDAELAVGLRHGGDTLAVPMRVLHARGSVTVEVGGKRLVVTWHAEEKAALVYENHLEDGELALRDGMLRGGDGAWDPLRGSPTEGADRSLARFPYLPTYLKAWRTYYPDGRVFEG